MKRSTYILVLGLILMAQPVQADPITLAANRVIVDNPPFYSVGGEDVLLGFEGNYALNHPGFIDIPYAIFDFGASSSAMSATLTWVCRSGYDGLDSITLYVGSDADGVISPADRFMGTAIDTFFARGGEMRVYDVTTYVNAALASGPYFAARLEATVPPDMLTKLYGGFFDAPSLDASGEVSPVPEPASLLLCGTGLVGLRAWRKRRQ